MFPLTADTDDSNYDSYVPASGSEYGGSSRSGSQSPSSGLNESNSAGPSAVNPTLEPSKSTRKRRAQLLPINLANASTTEADEISNGLPSTSISNSYDELAGHFPRPISTSKDLHDKRIRLALSSSSFSKVLLSLTGDASQSSSASVDLCYDSIDLDYSQFTPTVKLLPLSRCGERIAHGEFELVGSGQECKAVHIPSQTVHHCLAMNQDDYNSFLVVAERIEFAKNILTPDELRELKRLMMPEETRVIRAENGKTWYLISPDHQGSLHTFYNTENSSATNRARSPWSERESKTIFNQVVKLVYYCHKIGIYLGDFRMQKLVYTNKTKNEIRMLHLRNIYVAPNLEDHTIQKPSSKCCPAYIAPEMMRFDKPYAAPPADIWSLGILLFVLLTGRFPFYALRPAQLARMIRLGQWSFRPSDRVSRSARLLAYSLIRLNPLERPSAKVILMSDWFENPPVDSILLNSVNSPELRPVVTFQVNVPDNGRLAEANPRIPQQLLNVLMQTPIKRNLIYGRQPNIRANMESFANALYRSTQMSSDNGDQVVPERPKMTANDCDKDSLGIVVIQVDGPSTPTARS